MSSIIVVGAGMAGLTAATDLVAHGHDVVVLDKGSRPGGRMATRHEGDATFDHGAQFFTTKSDDFADVVTGWQDDDLATPWFRGGPERSAGTDPDQTSDGHPRFRGTTGMRSIPESLASPLDVRCGITVQAIRPQDDGWHVIIGDDHLAADAVIITAPAPQTRTLLEKGGVALVGDLEALPDITYDPCWAVMVRPDGTPDLPKHGALRLDDHPLHWISDNQRKGISSAPAVTLHASPGWTRQFLDVSPDGAGRRLLTEAADHVSGEVVRAHRWRYSNPLPMDLPETLVVTVPAPLAVAGDALAGGRVEGAFRSGRAAADAIHSRLDRD